jgi:putative thioredoxin
MQQPRNFSLHGAVDLGARQAVAQRRQQAPGGQVNGEQAGPPAAAVIDVTDETFNTDVIARSREVPVVLDLWADWCGPCKQLSPVLEKLAEEADGAWVLAKVDVDANPQLSAALQVQSIPMVVGVIAGQVVDGFLGAMPESQVREWLSQVMQVAERLGLGGEPAQAGASAAGDADGQPGSAGQVPGRPRPGLPPDPRDDPALQEAQQAIERGDLDTAVGAFEKMLAASPGHPVATMGLAQVGLIRRVNSYDQAKAARDAQENPADAAAQARMADIDLARGRIDVGFSRLLDTVRRTSGEERNKARVHLVGLFDVFPPRDPRVAKARATLSSLLF